MSVKAGLTSSNVSELRNIKDTCQKLVPAAQAFAKVSVDAGGTGGSAGWDGLSATATQTSSEVDDVLNADYGNGVQRRY
jgi:N-methylhydantoinase B/oxoprolinase/acetone carboxylase alpha subunit